MIFQTSMIMFHVNLQGCKQPTLITYHWVESSNRTFRRWNWTTPKLENNTSTSNDMGDISCEPWTKIRAVTVIGQALLQQKTDSKLKRICDEHIRCSSTCQVRYAQNQVHDYVCVMLVMTVTAKNEKNDHHLFFSHMLLLTCLHCPNIICKISQSRQNKLVVSTHLKKYARQIGSFPQGSRWKFQKIFELPPPSLTSHCLGLLLFHLWWPVTTQTISPQKHWFVLPVLLAHLQCFTMFRCAEAWWGGNQGSVLPSMSAPFDLSVWCNR